MEIIADAGVGEGKPSENGTVLTERSPSSLDSEVAKQLIRRSVISAGTSKPLHNRCRDDDATEIEKRNRSKNGPTLAERGPSNVDSEVVRQLIRLNVTSAETLMPFYDRVRDDDSISVLRCSESGVIVLATTAHVTQETTYEANTSFTYWGEGVETRRQSALKCSADDRRRASMIEPLLVGKKWLDVGTGAGGIMDIAADRAALAVACEPQLSARNAMKDDGFNVYAYVNDIPVSSDVQFDLCTSFHVLEHLLDPVGVLKDMHERMAPGGTCIVEVPHARDFLLDFLDWEPFKRFTLWSEHLVLYTRDSLKTVLEAAGFEDVVVRGIQRYPLANHLHWLRHKKPGGHQKWSQLLNDDLDKAYENLLGSLDATDTIVAYGKKAK